MSKEATKRESGAYIVNADGTWARLEYPEPKRLSKAGEWLKNNPSGIDIVIPDWEAVFGRPRYWDAPQKPAFYPQT